MKKLTAIALLAASCTALATTVKWRVNVHETASRTVSAYRGETLVFAPEFVENGGVVSNLTLSLCYQTNGMGSAWWTLPGTTFSPTNDCGASVYRFFIRAASTNEVNYRANGILKLLGSPGEPVNEIGLPVETLNFDAIAVVNAPWTTPDDLARAATAATNYADRAAAKKQDPLPYEEFEGAISKYTISVNYADTAGSTPNADTAGYAYGSGSADHASHSDKADADGDGNNIATTYETKTNVVATYATKTALVSAALAATNYTDSVINAEDQYLRTDVWVLGYEPYSLSADVTDSSTSNLRGKIITETTRTETSDGYARVYPYYLAPFTEPVSLAAVEIVSGAAETVDGQPFVVHGTSATPTNVTVRATTVDGLTREVSFSLSSAEKSTVTTSRLYTGDESALGTARKTINDTWLGVVGAYRGNSASNIVDTSKGSASEIFSACYFRSADGTRANLSTEFSMNVYRNDSTALLPGYAGGRNTGNGGSFVLGKRLVGNAAHWFGGVYAGRTCHVETADGTLHTLTMTGTDIVLADWAVAKWGSEGFKEKFGFDANLISDIRVIEVAEEIPDECVPSLLPYAEAVKAFESTGETNGNLDLSCGAFAIGQNNAVYPVWMSTLAAYGSTVLAGSDGGVTVREDCFTQYDVAPYYWNVRDGESGRPVYVLKSGGPILVGAFHTVGGGGSYICAADVIAELEKELGRDPDESLKRIGATDL